MVILMTVNDYERRTCFMIDYLRFAKGLTASMSRLFTGWFQKTINNRPAYLAYVGLLMMAVLGACSPSNKDE